MTSLMSLPTELQLEILAWIVASLDRAPSEAKFDSPPSTDLVRNSLHPLIELSLVCSFWRQLVLPKLFQYACIDIRQQIRKVTKRGGQFPSAQSSLSADSNYSTPTAFIKSLYVNVLDFIIFIKSNGLSPMIKSLVICSITNTHNENPESTPYIPYMSKEMAKLRDLVFERLDLTRFVIAMPPDTLTTFMVVLSGYSEYYRRSAYKPTMSMQYLCLSCSDNPERKIVGGNGRPRVEDTWSLPP